MKYLAKNSPLYEVVLDMVVHHLPDPLVAQKRRIPVIWHGDKESKEGKAMISCDATGPVGLMVTDISFDPHAGEVATGRLFSGSLKRGDSLYVMGSAKKRTGSSRSVSSWARSVSRSRRLSRGTSRQSPVSGTRCVGSTVTTLMEMAPFESLKHYSEPVMTVAVEAKNMKDLPKLVEVLRQVAKEDPTLGIAINEETGEHLISGMGELAPRDCHGPYQA